MPCVTDNELIRLSGADLPPGERERIDAHLADCAECRRRHQAFLRLAEVLGQWTIDPALHSVADRVRSAAAIDPSPGPRVVPLARRLAAWGRFAAAAALGAAIGFGLARTPAPSGPAQRLTEDTVSPEQALGLTALSIGSPAGLAAALDEIYADTTEGEERP